MQLLIVHLAHEDETTFTYCSALCCDSFSIQHTILKAFWYNWSISIPVACCESLYNNLHETSRHPPHKEADGQLCWNEYFLKSKLQNVSELNLQDGDGT